MQKAPAVKNLVFGCIRIASFLSWEEFLGIKAAGLNVHKDFYKRFLILV